MTKFIELVFQGVSLGAVYALIALGFVVVFKGSGVFNFAHANFVMGGAYVVVVAAPVMPYGAAVLVAFIVLVLLAVLVERLVLRQMVGRPVFAVIMATLGVAIMVQTVITMIWGYEDRGAADPIGSGVLHAGSVVLAEANIFILAMSVLLLATLWFFYQKTRYGLALRATASHQEAALAQGIDIRRMFVLSWAIAGALAVAAGISLGAFPRQVGLSMSFVALNALPAIILGGLDSLVGAVLGGVAVGLVQVLAAGYLGNVGEGHLQDVLPYLLMFAVLIVRPRGLLGSPEIERV